MRSGSAAAYDRCPELRLSGGDSTGTAGYPAVMHRDLPTSTAGGFTALTAAAEQSTYLDRAVSRVPLTVTVHRIPDLRA